MPKLWLLLKLVRVVAIPQIWVISPARIICIREGVIIPLLVLWLLVRSTRKNSSHGFIILLQFWTLVCGVTWQEKNSTKWWLLVAWFAEAAVYGQAPFVSPRLSTHLFGSPSSASLY